MTGNFLCADSAFSWAATEKGVALDSMQVSDDDSTFELGAYGEAGLCFGLSKRMTLILRARYDYLFDDAEMDFSNTSAEIYLSGVSASVGVGFSL